jgi:radical SAM/Cys-rich protein
MAAGSLRQRQSPLASTATQLEILESVCVPSFQDKLDGHGLSLRSGEIEILQVNVGKLCNQTCAHCHVDAGPDRREVMDRSIFELCLGALDRSTIPTVDITGGAPELNPHFRWFVEQVRERGRRVIDRCNLTILLLPSQAGLAEFLARNRVEIICSLPYYQQRETDLQRGSGVFERSIEALRKLNALGYGMDGSPLSLNIVYNPVGAYLPGAQRQVEADFRRVLLKRFGVSFNGLYAIANMPISRFLDFLIRSGNLEGYMERLVNAFNPAAVEGLMCRNTLSVGWDGRLYDCDFNQMLDLDVSPEYPVHIREFDHEKLRMRRIVTGRHCYGCTAGAGSSCGGSIVS